MSIATDDWGNFGDPNSQSAGCAIGKIDFFDFTH